MKSFNRIFQKFSQELKFGEDKNDFSWLTCWEGIASYKSLRECSWSCRSLNQIRLASCWRSTETSAFHSPLISFTSFVLFNQLAFSSPCANIPRRSLSALKIIAIVHINYANSFGIKPFASEQSWKIYKQKKLNCKHRASLVCEMTEMNNCRSEKSFDLICAVARLTFCEKKFYANLRCRMMNRMWMKTAERDETLRWCRYKSSIVICVRFEDNSRVAW